MRRIAIVGGGQAGLPLAFGLLDKGYDVTIVSNRTPDDIRNGKVMSSQCMFEPSLQIERELKINDWSSVCPDIEGISFSVVDPKKNSVKLIDWSSPLSNPAQAVDQRIKMPAWLEKFSARGGQVIIQDVGIEELEILTKENDLVILAAGKGDIVNLFELDRARSYFEKPQRSLALTYVHGLEPSSFPSISFNLLPGVGEYFVFPALTLSGPCDIMVFEGIPGGPLDVWKDIRTPQEHLAASKAFLDNYLPLEAERAYNIELTDSKGFLSGSFTPSVRKPVLTLPSGRMVFGLGDALVTNDPITGQGSNNAIKASKIYLDSIFDRGDQVYSREWMEQTFELFWKYAYWVVKWTNSLLTPPPPHVLNLLTAAAELPSLASIITNGFNNPPNFYPWWDDAEECDRLILEHKNIVY
ncbi:styrene monooxygenase/indole monooxygenase family protein [Serratia sp. T13T92]|uniref:styrene monooxygenase/indole monooxygenase family protein n=1 Tax=Serratia sp. T13T92 TaxID=3397496 RepID=UPI0039E01A5E